ncbi:MAG TPA: hypothetical protein VNF69_13475 [Burkholderiales bacterium]|nr:hypothetical protein [Burkholderiales bacterium]
MTTRTRSILLLGRRDHAEAMRVAAGLTIFGHRVRLVMMGGPVADSAENAAQLELLDLADIVPQTTVTGQELELLDAPALADAMRAADVVMSI